MNEIQPFDTVVPTLENLVDYFGSEIRKRIREVGGELTRIEGSETPTRSYVVSYVRDEEYIKDIRQQSQESLSRVIDDMLDRVLE